MPNIGSMHPYVVHIVVGFVIAGCVLRIISLTGKWTVTVTIPQGAYTNAFDLTSTPEGAISGNVTGDSATGSITTGTLTGNKFTFTANLSTGGGPITATFSGTIDGHAIKGTFDGGGDLKGDFAGTRPGGAGRGSLTAGDASTGEDEELIDDHSPDAQRRRGSFIMQNRSRS